MFYAKHARSLEKVFSKIIIIVQCDKMRLGGKSSLAKENTSTTNVQRKWFFFQHTKHLKYYYQQRLEGRLMVLNQTCSNMQLENRIYSIKINRLISKLIKIIIILGISEIRNDINRISIHIIQVILQIYDIFGAELSLCFV